jgi:hypothetical protein
MAIQQPEGHGGPAPGWDGVWTRLALLLVAYAGVSGLRWWDSGEPIGALLSPVVVGTIMGTLMAALLGRGALAELQGRGDEGPAELYSWLVLLVALASLNLESALLSVGIWLGALAVAAVLGRRPSLET